MEYTFYPADSFSLALFVLLNISIILLILSPLYKRDKKKLKQVSVFFVLWIVLFSSVVYSGIIKEHFIPAGPIFFLTLVGGAFFFGFNRWGTFYSQNVSLWLLLAFQGFRFPLELILHHWADIRTVPETMTWTGQNVDILSGIMCLLSLLPFLRNKTFYWLCNIAGIVLLLNVFRVVLMSAPLPFAWPLENPVQLIMYMPYALIGFICVWAALAGHIIITRSLLRKH